MEIFIRSSFILPTPLSVSTFSTIPPCCQFNVFLESSQVPHSSWLLSLTYKGEGRTSSLFSAFGLSIRWYIAHTLQPQNFGNDAMEHWTPGDEWHLHHFPQIFLSLFDPNTWGAAIFSVGFMVHGISFRDYLCRNGGFSHCSYICGTVTVSLKSFIQPSNFFPK